MTKLIYGYDPLCGWCFGFIPALKYFEACHPEIDIEILPGGLVRGERVKPYSNMVQYISQAAPQLALATGCKPSAAFFELIQSENPPLMDSAPPTHAVMQVAALAPGKVIDFACEIQEAHFLRGKDLNHDKVYRQATTKLDLPNLDLDAIVSAKESDPLVSESYQRAESMGINSFPTIFVLDDYGTRIGTSSGIYDPKSFTAEIEAFIEGSNAEKVGN